MPRWSSGSFTVPSALKIASSESCVTTIELISKYRWRLPRRRPRRATEARRGKRQRLALEGKDALEDTCGVQKRSYRHQSRKISYEIPRHDCRPRIETLRPAPTGPVTKT